MEPTIILKIQDLARGGAGVSRDSEGRVIFVPYTAPGDLVRVRIVEQEKRYAQAELIEVLEPSHQRQTPRCAVFGKCGGCQWQHLPYEVQWQTKSNGVLHALKRVQVDPPGLEQIPAEQIWEYRNRVQLRGFGAEIGFYQIQSKNLVPIERCEIAHSEINSSLAQTREEGSSRKMPYKVELEVLPTGELRKTWNSGHSANGFRQVHDAQNEKLKTWIHDSLPSSDILYDLYGGSGNLSQPLMEKMKEIHCVDFGSPRTKPASFPDHFHFHRSGVVEWLRNRKSVPQANAVAILDPPRDGLAQDFSEIAKHVEDLGVKNLIAVGCDPDAWARDTSRWVKRGWRLERLMVIDLFPQTPHIESVGVLRRQPNPYSPL